jgi:hypothetical protein
LLATTDKPGFQSPIDDFPASAALLRIPAHPLHQARIDGKTRRARMLARLAMTA